MVNEASFLCSGYGKYGKEVLKRLYETEKYELAELAIYGKINDLRNTNVPWVYYANTPNDDDPSMQAYNSNPVNQFGQWRFERVLLDP